MENHCGASHRIACYIDKWHSLASFIRFGVNVRARAQALWLISKCCSENWSEKKSAKDWRTKDRSIRDAPATCVERHALMHHELVMYTKPIISWLKTINIIVMIMQPNGFDGDWGEEKKRNEIQQTNEKKAELSTETKPMMMMRCFVFYVCSFQCVWSKGFLYVCLCVCALVLGLSISVCVSILLLRGALAHQSNIAIRFRIFT